MANRDKFFFFGFGQTAKYFIKELLVSKKKFKFDATNTKKTLQKSFKGKKFKSYKFKDKKYDKKLIDALNQSDYILISIPPIIVSPRYCLWYCPEMGSLNTKPRA